MGGRWKGLRRPRRLLDHPSSGFAAAVILSLAASVAGAATFNRPVHVRLSGELTPQVQQNLLRQLQRAEDLQSDLILLEIDSLKGDWEAAQPVLQWLQQPHVARTLAYIPMKARGAAAGVALACDEIVMNQHALLGDAASAAPADDPVGKMTLARQFRDLAEARKRPAALAEAMVDGSLKIWKVKNAADQRTTWMTDAELKAQANEKEWIRLAPLAEAVEGRPLLVAGRSAVELGLASANVNDLASLRARLAIEAEPILLRESWVDTTVAVLNHPVSTVLLIVLGLLCVYIEFAVAGMGIASLPAGLCFVLFFWSKFLGGTAGWLEVVLFVSGLACLALEIFVIPGFGVVGLAGLAMVFLSLFMAMQGFVFPHNAVEVKVVGQTLLQFGAAAVLLVGGAGMITRHLGSLPVFNRLMLKPADDGTPTAPDALYTFQAPVVGARGVAATDLRPAGKIRVGQQIVDVVTDGFFVEAGRAVEVVQVTGSRVVVRQTA